MYNIFFSYGFLNLMIVEFDTEDNIFRTNKTPWEQNLDLDTYDFISTYGLYRYSTNKIWFKSKNKIRSIRLNNFKYKYKIKKISDYHFEIYCSQLINYFDEHDNIEVIVKFYE
jgi:hypothetical protein